jgi:antitoxin YefM
VNLGHDPYARTAYSIGVAEGFMRVINFSDARNQLKQVIDQVVDDADFTVIARRNAQDAVVMSMDTFNSLMETLHLMKSPANAKHLEKSIGQFRKDRAKTKELVDAK